MKLSNRQHALLVEALRRHTRFNLKVDGLGMPLTEAWTGLGSATTYQPAVDAGLMVCATELNPGHTTWWKLTVKGALIVAFWHGKGFDFKRIEAGELPPMDVTP